MAGRVDGDAGREVEEEVAVDVLDRQALAADRDDRVGARQARRRPRLVERDVGAGLGARELRDDVRDGAIAGEPDAAVDKGHLEAVTAMHSEYAEWILARGV